MTDPQPHSAAYVDLAAALVGLPIPSEYHQSVVQNFDRIATVAQLFLNFPLPEDIEIAPIFEPE